MLPIRRAASLSCAMALMLVGLSLGLAAQTRTPSLGAEIPVAEDREILAVGLTRSRRIVLATREPCGDKEVVRLIHCDETGKVVETQAWELDDYLSCRAFATVEGFIVGWVKDSGGLWWARETGDKLQEEMVLEDSDMPKGSTVDWWLVENKGERWLFINRYEPAYQDPTTIAEVHEEREWVYAYTLGAGKPTFKGKVCVQEEGFIRPGETECALVQGDIWIWQRFSVSQYWQADFPSKSEALIWVPEPPSSLRVAKWPNDGKLDWQLRYVGIGLFPVHMDFGDASAVVVQEPKGNELGPVIRCAVYAGDGRIVPLAAAERFKQILATGGTEYKWVLATSTSDDIVVTRYDVNFQPRASERFSKKEVVDFRVVARANDLYLVMLEKDRVKVHKIGGVP